MKTKAINFLNSLINDETTKKEIDLIDFIKKCVKEHKEEQKKTEVEWKPMFEVLWKMYPRKINKQLAMRTFEHKIRGLNEEDCKTKCNQIFKAQKIAQNQWKMNGTELTYIPHYSSFLNANVPNSEHFKGR